MCRFPCEPALQLQAVAAPSHKPHCPGSHRHYCWLSHFTWLQWSWRPPWWTLLRALRRWLSHHEGGGRAAAPFGDLDLIHPSLNTPAVMPRVTSTTEVWHVSDFDCMPNSWKSNSWQTSAGFTPAARWYPSTPHSTWAWWSPCSGGTRQSLGHSRGRTVVWQNLGSHICATVRPAKYFRSELATETSMNEVSVSFESLQRTSDQVPYIFLSYRLILCFTSSATYLSKEMDPW